MTDDPRIDPADLRAVRFPGSRRRYEAPAVDDFLEMVAQRVEATNALVDELRAQLDGIDASASGGSSAFTLLPPDEPDPEPKAETVFDAEPEPASEPAPSPERPDLGTMSDDELLGLVGEETAHVLSTARRAADDIRSKAEESAARVIREATAESKRLIDEAETRQNELTAEAQSARDDAVAAAEAEGTALRAQAEAEADAIRTQAEADVAAVTARIEQTRIEAEAEAARAIDEARDQGRAMVAEAKDVRARILADLQRRRDAGRAQVERLAAGRSRLLDAYAAVRQNVEDITGQLDTALIDEPEPETDLEAEIEQAPAVVAAVDEVDEVDGVDTPDDPAPEPEPAVEPEAADEPGPVADVEPEPEVLPDSGVEDGDGPVGADEPDDDEADTEPPGSGRDVDALFERIRAERAESVARAQHVLAGDEPEPEPVAEAEPEPAEVEPEPETTAEDVIRTDGADQVPPELLASGPVHDQRAEVVAKLEKSLSRALKRYLADEQNEVLDSLRQSESTEVGELLPARDAHVDGYADVAIDALAAAAESGASTVDGDGATADVGALAIALAESLIDPFRRRIEDTAADVDGDADALDERLRALYREWKVERIGPSALDALLGAFAAGQHAAAPDGAPLRWLIDPEQGPCPDAQDNALAGVVPKGEVFPTGDACPQAHPGCRCLLAMGG